MSRLMLATTEGAIVTKKTTTGGGGAGELLTVRQAADRYGFHPSTIRKWITCGALAAVRVGPHRRIRVRAADLERRT